MVTVPSVVESAGNTGCAGGVADFVVVSSATSAEVESAANTTAIQAVDFAMRFFLNFPRLDNYAWTKYRPECKQYNWLSVTVSGHC
jgi:hypothetical protein